MDVLDVDLFYEGEAEFRHDHLDVPYVLDVATDVANLLVTEGCAEAAYQPGDGTFYGLVFVAMRTLDHARPRIVDGVVWESRSMRGMYAEHSERTVRTDDGLVYTVHGYDPHGVFVSWVEHASYPLRLHRSRGTLAASYIGEKFKTTGGSAVSLAVLFRAIAAKLP